MNVLIMILGILMVLCGGSCMFTPLRTFLASGYALMVLLALTTGILIGAYFIVSRINMIFLSSQNANNQYALRVWMR